MVEPRPPKASGWPSMPPATSSCSTSKALTARREASRGWRLSRQHRSLHSLLQMFCWLICGPLISVGMERLTMACSKLSSKLTLNFSLKSQVKSCFLFLETSMNAKIALKASKESSRPIWTEFGTKFTSQISLLIRSQATFSTSITVCCPTSNLRKTNSLTRHCSLSLDLRLMFKIACFWTISSSKMYLLMACRTMCRRRGSQSESRRNWTCLTRELWLLITDVQN